MKQMNFSSKRFAVAIAIAGGMMLTTAFASDSTHTRSGEVTVNGVNKCQAAHNELKSILKDRSREHCESSHDSSGSNILRNENYTKSSCVKRKSGSQVTGIDVSGALTYNCKI